MFMKSNKMRHILVIVCISAFALTSFPLVQGSFADTWSRRDGTYRHVRVDRVKDKRGVASHRFDRWKGKRRVISPRVHRHGHVVSRLPLGYRRTWYNKQPYYYRHGVFYRSSRSGFIVVGAPVGAVVVGLPVGYQRLWVADSVYYVYGGTFYRRVPAGYAVVRPPATVVVEEAVPELVQPSVSASGEVIINAPVLNVRSGPSLEYPRIYQIDEGYILEIYGRSDGWLYVQLPNGEYGWVKEVFTSPVEPASG